jgi:phospholipase/lecithinase/hemolysin
MRVLRFIAAAAAVFATLPPAAADAAGIVYDRMFVFGDSLSDTGNVYAETHGLAPPDPPYFAGRFSDGPNWVDRFAGAFGVELSPALAPPTSDSLNFAFGSAQTGWENRVPSPDFEAAVPGLLGQAAGYTQELPVDPGALHVVWSGANDYILPFFEPVVFGTAFDAYLQPDADRTVGNIAAALSHLIGAGVTDFLVPNLPDLGAIPLAARLPDLLDGLLTAEERDRLLAGFADPAEALAAYTAQHNAALAEALDGLSAANPGITLMSFDVYGLFEEVFAEPEAFGLDDVESGAAEFCLFDSAIAQDVDNCALLGPTAARRAFIDEQHPSAAMHAIIADAALEAVGVPEPGTVLLLAAGLGGLACQIAGRRRMAQRAAAG